MADDLFAEAEEAKRTRLTELGWERKFVYGAWCWEHPETHAWWFDEAKVFEWLERHEKGGTPDDR